MSNVSHIIAQALAADIGADGPDEYQDCIGQSEAILSALAAAGYVIAPREPTEAILDAFWHQAGESRQMRERVHHRARYYWKAMTDAAQVNA